MSGYNLKTAPVQCIKASDYENFEDIFKSQFYIQRVPIIMKSLKVGPCVKKWTWNYLKEKCGDKNIKVHVSTTDKLNFIGKNFSYESMKFCDFLDNIIKEESDGDSKMQPLKYYLRSLGDDPRKDICNLEKHFSEISEDVQYPCLFDKDKIFSSVFRIASKGVQLWTHYDIMDNILLEVRGRKKVTLFSPDDVDYLYMTGDKSAVIDIDNADPIKYPLFSNVTHHQCYLEEGDVLFIPALWFHNVINETSTVSVNVFWRHLDSSQYDPSDIYGNKDLLAANSIESIIDRAINKISALPPVYKEFYTRRFINKIKDKCL